MEMGLKEAAPEAKKEEKMEMGLKEAATKAKKEEKMEMRLKEVEAWEIPVGFDRRCLWILEPPKDPPKQFRLSSNHVVSSPIHAWKARSNDGSQSSFILQSPNSKSQQHSILLL